MIALYLLLKYFQPISKLQSRMRNGFASISQADSPVWTSRLVDEQRNTYHVQESLSELGKALRCIKHLSSMHLHRATTNDTFCNVLTNWRRFLFTTCRSLGCGGFLIGKPYFLHFCFISKTRSYIQSHQ